MGLDYYVHLFDLKTYREKALPAYRAFFDQDDSAPLILLLQEIILGVISPIHNVRRSRRPDVL